MGISQSWFMSIVGDKTLDPTQSPERNMLEMSYPFELNKKYEFNGIEQISLEGKVKAMYYFLTGCNYPIVPDDFDWAWITKKGKLTTRIKSFYFKTHGIKITPKELETLGNILESNLLRAETYVLDFTNNLDWDAGDFGDSGSCFWSSNAEARHVMENNGFLAIRFFNVKNQTRGIGRAWLAPNRPSDGYFILFNAYGPYHLRKVARIFADFIKVPSVQTVDIRNNNSSGGTLYLNGGEGLIVGPAHKDISRYDFNILVPKCIGACFVCEERLMDTDDHYRVGYNERLLCPTCYPNYIKTCDCCGGEEYVDDMSTVFIDEATTVEYCVSCAIDPKNALFCSGCFRYHAPNRIIPAAYSQPTLCIDCVNSMQPCDHCKNKFLPKNLNTTVDGQRLCSPCVRNSYRCDKCNAVKFRDEEYPLHVGGMFGDRYCAACASEHTKHCVLCGISFPHNGNKRIRLCQRCKDAAR